LAGRGFRLRLGQCRLRRPQVVARVVDRPPGIAGGIVDQHVALLHLLAGFDFDVIDD
jgi:hypothetical protein